MYILAYMKLKKIIENQDLYITTKKNLKKNNNKTFFPFNLKHFIFSKYICKIYKL